MPLTLQSFATVAEAEDALRRDGSRFLGGGTLVIRAASEGDLSFDTFVSTRDPRMDAVEITPKTITLGASVTMATIARHPDLGWLAPAARAVGGPAVRNMATIGGNLFARPPYGDFAVALLALDAMVRFAERDVPIESFLDGSEKAGGIVTAVRFGVPKAGSFRFLKVSRVRPKGVSVLSIAAVLDISADGTIGGARIALGCMADRPMRAKAAEAALEGVKATEDGIAKAVAAIGEGTSPITDPIASGWYRGEVLPVHFRRLVLN